MISNFSYSFSSFWFVLRFAFWRFVLLSRKSYKNVKWFYFLVLDLFIFGVFDIDLAHRKDSQME